MVVEQKRETKDSGFLDFLAPFAVEVWLWVVGFHFVFGLSLKIISALKKESGGKSRAKGRGVGETAAEGKTEEETEGAAAAVQGSKTRDGGGISGIGKKLAAKEEEEEEEEFDFGWRESLWYFWAAFIQLGTDRSPKSFEGKLLSSG